MEIQNKRQFYDLWQAGCLGNTLRNWKTLEEALSSDAHTFGVRQVGVAGGGRHTIAQRAVLADAITIWERGGWPYIIDEAAPDSDVVLQGEICRTTRGWEGFLGIRTGQRMRDSIRMGLLRPYVGVTVRALLHQFLDSSSRDDVDALFDLYPDAVIELASYPYALGKLKRNTLIWEVRNY